MPKPWHFTVDQFVNSTKKNFKKAMGLSNYSHAYMLNKMNVEPGDPDWATFFGWIDPGHQSMVGDYTKLATERALRKGHTASLDQLLAALPNEAEDWEYIVLGEYKKGTPEYISIFPNGRAPFGKGSKDARIQAVKTLGENLAPHAALAGLKTTVDDHYTTLDNSRDTQLGTKGDVAALSANLDASRIVAMRNLYRLLGGLIAKYYQTPGLIAPFFDLALLRDIRQTLWTATLDSGESRNLFTRTFVMDDELRIELQGPGPVALYLASSPGGTDSDPVITPGNTEHTIVVTAFNVSNYGAHRYLTAVNQSGAETHLEVEAL